MDIVTLLNIFSCYSTQQSSTKNLKYCFLHDKFGITPLNEKKLTKIDQSFPHGWLIGYGISILDSFLAQSKVFRIHAKLNNTFGELKQRKTMDLVIVVC